MSWDIDLAKELKQRNNVSSIGAVIGKVVSSKPSISIDNGQILLQKDNLYICDKAKDIQINDRVMIIATEDGQKFFVIDKII